MSDNEGTTFKVPYTKVLDVQPHFNAHSLDVLTIYGFQVIASKHKYKIGDMVLYVPIDSILPQELEDILFPVDSKIKLDKHRVRQIKIRGLASQGMIFNPLDFTNLKYKLEQDYASELGITKYEPPQSKVEQLASKSSNKKKGHSLFKKYNGVENIKWFPNLFKETDSVVIQEKLHGTNARAGILPYEANTLWKKFKKLLRLVPQYEFFYGSNNVDITSKLSYTGFYGEDIYGEVFKKMNIKDMLKPNEIVYGEIVGPGIQKIYDYGLKEHEFILFDVRKDGKWLNPIEVEMYAKSRNLKMIPVLYYGNYNKELAYKLTSGPSVFHQGTKVREGIVIKDAINYDTITSKRAVKWINEDYLADKNNTDNH